MNLSISPETHDEGASSVEYGLLVAAIAAVVILVLFALGTWVRGTFTDTCQQFNNAGVSSGRTCN